MPTYQASTALARRNTLRSIPLIRPAAVVFGPSDLFKAEWALSVARRDVAILEEATAYRYAALGKANQVRGAMRRHWQAQAFRHVNTHRAELRRARKALVAAEAAMLAFAPRVAA